MGRLSTQVENVLTHAGSKPIQMGRVPTHTEKDRVPSVQTLSYQVRIAARYHAGKERFSSAQPDL